MTGDDEHVRFLRPETPIGISVSNALENAKMRVIAYIQPLAYCNCVRSTDKQLWEVVMRSTISTLVAALALLAIPHVAEAQKLKATPKSSAGLFCTLCKAQGCSCNSNSTQCVNCGANLKAKSATVTKKACADAKGRLANGRCQLK
jgi:hypothetical protein